MGAKAQTGLAGQAALQHFHVLTQGFTVGHDRGLRFTRQHQPLQVAQNGAGLCTGLFIQGKQGVQLFTGLGVLGARQAQFGAAVAGPGPVP